MKIISNLKRMAIVAALVVGVASCSDDDDGNGGNPDVELNIVATAAVESDLTSLVAALEKADLLGTLNGNGPFTVLAPTNEAFAQLFTDLNVSSLDELSAEVLRPILLNHVIAGAELSAEDLIAEGSGYANTESTIDGNKLSIYYSTEGEVTFNGISTVVQPDVDASNGVIHKVDAVITLPTITTFAQADDVRFSTLEAALTVLTPGTDFPAILSREENNDDGVNPPFTVFAPTNMAFDANDVPTDEATVTAIIQAHVISGVNVQSSMLSQVEGDVTTLNGDVTVVANPPTVQGAGNPNPIEINLDFVDIQAVNGVIHAVNDVILPAQ